ncbi:unnamed protein product [Adineta steineri]|uniref:Uncharacterized protein n=1 Tax=Adineta steineri TaxID=433720 RepID=A0A814CQ67_9BILA|nr:unnamed protein product [Adineta steineri]
MKIKDIFEWFYTKISHYNLFMPDEEEYHEDNDEPTDPTIVIKHQRYATRLYVLLLIITIYIVFILNLMNPQTRAITLSNITPSLYNQLRLEHPETLSCPCTSTSISYKTFVSNTIVYHPICTSVFVSEEWIKALYDPYASSYLVMDFRTTASSQFKFLAAFCSLSKTLISQALTDIDNSQLITIQLLSENEIQSEISGNIEIIQSSTPSQLIRPLDFLHVTTQSIFFISALKTNFAVYIRLTALFASTGEFYVTPTYYSPDPNDFNISAVQSSSCELTSSVTPAGFFSLTLTDNTFPNAFIYEIWPYFSPAHKNITISSMIDGFFGGCTPLDAVLASTFDCLYNQSCLEMLVDYFPQLSSTDLAWTNSLSVSSLKNQSLKNILPKLFVEEWSTNISYSKYFIQCAPVSCTYTETDQISLFYTISLFLSIYGGLCIILRSTALFLIYVWMKLKRYSINNNNNINIGSISILILFTSLSVQMTIITQSNPSLVTYRLLHQLYSDSLKCPCKKISISYDIFITLSLTLHQICSSGFISESWISTMTLLNDQPVYNTKLDAGLDGFGSRYFKLLSSICQLANRTIDDAVRQFLTKSFVTQYVISESEFNAKFNTTFKQFKQSLITEFNLLTDMVHLFTRVDQPYTNSKNAELLPITPSDETSNQSPPELKFSFTGPIDINSTSIDCICATNPRCQSSVVLYKWALLPNGDQDLTTPYLVPGYIAGCFMLDSLQLSTLECFYDETCLLIYYYYIIWTRLLYNIYDWSAVHPLVYDNTSSRFPPETSLSVIVREMMVEQWNFSCSFEQHYEACSPNYCTYSYTTHTYDLLGIIIQMISMLGGLTVALRLITPQIVRIILRLISPQVNTEPEGNYLSAIINY